ncbi:hypothetical protein B0H10DRAFT_2207271 [Mycena sp. CBHHK59/15]|nr:hypothetical protein B0H10DRAFT_2207271 [Mycena sp. CBHHK59/15]
MTSTPANATTPSNSSDELQALVAQVSALSKMALDMTTICIDVQAKLPHVVASKVAAAVEAVKPEAPGWVRSVPRTPGQLEAAHPPGSGDDLSKYSLHVR